MLPLHSCSCRSEEPNHPVTNTGYVQKIPTLYELSPQKRGHGRNSVVYLASSTWFNSFVLHAAANHPRLSHHNGFGVFRYEPDPAKTTQDKIETQAQNPLNLNTTNSCKQPVTCKYASHPFHLGKLAKLLSRCNQPYISRIFNDVGYRELGGNESPPSPWPIIHPASRQVSWGTRPFTISHHPPDPPEAPTRQCRH